MPLLSPATRTSLILLAFLCVRPAASSADILSPMNFTPNPADLSDLDHHSLYTWRIDDIDLTGKEVTSVTLTFEQMYNWDNTANQLFIHLLDTARKPGVSEFVDDPFGGLAINEQDDFAINYDPWWSPAFHSRSDWLVDSGTGDMLLTNRGFAGPSTNPNNIPSPVGDLSGWTYANCASDAGGPKNPCDYTYTFSSDEIDQFQSFVGDIGGIALGLDPDCHFFNEGVVMTVNATSLSAIPEPSTLVLFGTGLLAAYRRHRRQKHSC